MELPYLFLLSHHIYVTSVILR